MYKPRNPFTPSQIEYFSPVGYLGRFLAFKRWDIENPVVHLESIEHPYHLTLSKSDMCCLNALKWRIDRTLLELAGCKAGIWPEPSGFQKWLAFAWKRLQELEEGHYFPALWTATLTKMDEGINEWFFNTPATQRPGFTLKQFESVCQKYGFRPDLKLVAACFRVP